MGHDAFIQELLSAWTAASDYCSESVMSHMSEWDMLHALWSSLVSAWKTAEDYGVATISMLLKIYGLFCKRAL